MPFDPASRAYSRRVLLLCIAYAVLLIAAVYLFKERLVTGPIGYVVAVLPALPIIGVFVSIGRYLVEQQDEYQRMLMVRQSLFASGFALSFATLWGFLEAFDLVGHVEAYYIAVLWFGGLGLGACVNKLTMGGANE